MTEKMINPHNFGLKDGDVPDEPKSIRKRKAVQKGLSLAEYSGMLPEKDIEAIQKGMVEAQESLDIAYANGVKWGREVERVAIIDILEKKEWFGKALSANERFTVIKWLREVKVK